MAYNEAMIMVRSPYIQDALGMSSLSPLVHQYTLEPEKKKKKKNKNKDDDDDDDDDESQEVKTKNKKQDDNYISSSHSIEVEQINDPMRNMRLFSQTNREQIKDEQSR
jgi:hypothetical protein